MPGVRRGSSSHHREQWRSTYERTHYTELPWFASGPSPQVVAAVDEGFLPRGGSTLDIGCGAGSNVLYLARQGFEAHGVDISPGAVRAAAARAEKEGLHADFQVGDALRLEFPAARFDAVTDYGCFHTLPIRRRRDYAREVSRVLRAGGACVVSWVGRENTAAFGPSHRPSVEEVVRVFEPMFLVVRTRYHPPSRPGAFSMYDAWLTKRRTAQPPPR